MKVIIVLLAAMLLAIAFVWYVYRKKAIFIPALLGLGRMPKVRPEEYYGTSRNFRNASENDRMSFYMQHPVFGGHMHMFFNTEDNVLKAIAPVKYAAFMKAQGRKAQTGSSVNAFNYLIAQVQNKKARLISEIYPAAEIKKDPYKARLTGIFYQGSPGTPLAIIVPGGGFISNVTDCEGYPIAMKLHEKGYSVLVISYPVGKQLGETEQHKQGEEACRQLVQVVRFLKDQQQELHIDLEDYAIFGFSAGGMMTTSFSFAGYRDCCHKYGLPRPKVICPIYGLDWNVEPQEGDRGLSVFSVVGREDPYGFGSIERKLPVLRDILGEENVCVRVYDGLEHGFGIGTGTAAERWLQEAVDFWEKHRQ